MELLLINDPEKPEKKHVYIKDFNRLLYSQSAHKEKKHFCMHCLHSFSTKERLDNHIKYCFSINGTQAMKMPEEGGQVYFKNHHKQLPVPSVIYADFEAINEKIYSCIPSNDKSYTQTYQKHEACGFGHKVVCHYDKKIFKIHRNLPR